MDNLLVPACILLALTNLAFALLGLYWKHKAKASEHAAMGLARTAHESFNAGYQQASKIVVGHMFLAAFRLPADDQTLDALKAAGRRLIGEPIDESVVQVPQEV